jgi:hypothetical protein
MQDPYKTHEYQEHRAAKNTHALVCVFHTRLSGKNHFKITICTMVYFHRIGVKFFTISINVFN